MVAGSIATAIASYFTMYCASILIFYISPCQALTSLTTKIYSIQSIKLQKSKVNHYQVFSPQTTSYQMLNVKNCARTVHGCYAYKRNSFNDAEYASVSNVETTSDVLRRLKDSSLKVVSL